MHFHADLSITHAFFFLIFQVGSVSLLGSSAEAVSVWLTRLPFIGKNHIAACLSWRGRFVVGRLPGSALSDRLLLAGCVASQRDDSERHRLRL